MKLFVRLFSTTSHLQNLKDVVAEATEAILALVAEEQTARCLRRTTRSSIPTRHRLFPFSQVHP